MKRWHQEYQRTVREWKKHRKSHVESNKRFRQTNRIGLSPEVLDCRCDEQKGRFRKTDAFDCGVPHCPTCHSDKYPKRSKREHELRSDFSFNEQLRERSVVEQKGCKDGKQVSEA